MNGQQWDRMGFYGRQWILKESTGERWEIQARVSWPHQLLPLAGARPLSPVDSCVLTLRNFMQIFQIPRSQPSLKLRQAGWDGVTGEAAVSDLETIDCLDWALPECGFFGVR